MANTDIYKILDIDHLRDRYITGDIQVTSGGGSGPSTGENSDVKGKHLRVEDVIYLKELAMQIMAARRWFDYESVDTVKYVTGTTSYDLFPLVGMEIGRVFVDPDPVDPDVETPTPSMSPSGGYCELHPAFPESILWPLTQVKKVSDLFPCSDDVEWSGDDGIYTTQLRVNSHVFINPYMEKAGEARPAYSSNFDVFTAIVGSAMSAGGLCPGKRALEFLLSRLNRYIIGSEYELEYVRNKLSSGYCGLPGGSDFSVRPPFLGIHSYERWGYRGSGEFKHYITGVGIRTAPCSPYVRRSFSLRSSPLVLSSSLEILPFSGWKEYGTGAEADYVVKNSLGGGRFEHDVSTYTDSYVKGERDNEKVVDYVVEHVYPAYLDLAESVACSLCGCENLSALYDKISMNDDVDSAFSFSGVNTANALYGLSLGDAMRTGRISLKWLSCLHDVGMLCRRLLTFISPLGRGNRSSNVRYAHGSRTVSYNSPTYTTDTKESSSSYGEGSEDHPGSLTTTATRVRKTLVKSEYRSSTDPAEFGSATVSGVDFSFSRSARVGFGNSYGLSFDDRMQSESTYNYYYANEGDEHCTAELTSSSYSLSGKMTYNSEYSYAATFEGDVYSGLHRLYPVVGLRFPVSSPVFSSMFIRELSGFIPVTVYVDLDFSGMDSNYELVDAGPVDDDDDDDNDDDEDKEHYSSDLHYANNLVKPVRWRKRVCVFVPVTINIDPKPVDVTSTYGGHVTGKLSRSVGDILDTALSAASGSMGVDLGNSDTCLFPSEYLTGGVPSADEVVPAFFRKFMFPSGHISSDVSVQTHDDRYDKALAGSYGGERNLFIDVSVTINPAEFGIYAMSDSPVVDGKIYVQADRSPIDKPAEEKTYKSHTYESGNLDLSNLIPWTAEVELPAQI